MYKTEKGHGGIHSGFYSRVGPVFWAEASALGLCDLEPEGQERGS